MLTPCRAHTEDRATGRLREAVEAYLTGVHGLVATCLDPRIARGWRLTHAASGRAIGGGAWSGSAHFASAEAADAAARRWLGDQDWTRSAAVIREDEVAARAVARMVAALADAEAQDAERVVAGGEG